MCLVEVDFSVDGVFVLYRECYAVPTGVPMPLLGGVKKFWRGISVRPWGVSHNLETHGCNAVVGSGRSLGRLEC